MNLRPAVCAGVSPDRVPMRCLTTKGWCLFARLYLRPVRAGLLLRFSERAEFAEDLRFLDYVQLCYVRMGTAHVAAPTRP